MGRHGNQRSNPHRHRAGRGAPRGRQLPGALLGDGAASRGAQDTGAAPGNATSPTEGAADAPAPGPPGALPAPAPTAPAGVFGQLGGPASPRVNGARVFAQGAIQQRTPTPALLAAQAQAQAQRPALFGAAFSTEGGNYFLGHQEDPVTSDDARPSPADAPLGRAVDSPWRGALAAAAHAAQAPTRASSCVSQAYFSAFSGSLAGSASSSVGFSLQPSAPPSPERASPLRMLHAAAAQASGDDGAAPGFGAFGEISPTRLQQSGRARALAALAQLSPDPRHAHRAPCGPPPPAAAAGIRAGLGAPLDRLEALASLLPAANPATTIFAPPLPVRRSATVREGLAAHQDGSLPAPASPPSTPATSMSHGASLEEGDSAVVLVSRPGTPSDGGGASPRGAPTPHSSPRDGRAAGSGPRGQQLGFDLAAELQGAAIEGVFGAFYDRPIAQHLQLEAERAAAAAAETASLAAGSDDERSGDLEAERSQVWGEEEEETFRVDIDAGDDEQPWQVPAWGRAAGAEGVAAGAASAARRSPPGAKGSLKLQLSAAFGGLQGTSTERVASMHRMAESLALAGSRAAGGRTPGTGRPAPVAVPASPAASPAPAGSVRKLGAGADGVSAEVRAALEAPLLQRISGLEVVVASMEARLRDALERAEDGAALAAREAARCAALRREAAALRAALAEAERAAEEAAAGGQALNCADLLEARRENESLRAQLAAVGGGRRGGDEGGGAEGGSELNSGALLESAGGEGREEAPGVTYSPFWAGTFALRRSSGGCGEH